MTRPGRARRRASADDGWARQLRITGFLGIAAVAVVAAAGFGLFDHVSVPRWSPTHGDSQEASQKVVRPGDDLAAAVAATRDGGTLRLTAGTFKLTRPLVIRRPILIVGARGGRTYITGVSYRPLLWVRGNPSVRVTHVVFRRAVGGKAGMVRIWASGEAGVAFSECVFHSFSADGGERAPVLDVRAESLVTLRTCSIAGGSTGVSATDAVHLFVARSHITGCGIGVASTGKADVTLRDCVVAGNESTGVEAIAQTHLSLRDTRVLDNQRGSGKPGVGVHVGDDADAAVAGCTCGNRPAGRQRGGILVDGSARALISATRCPANLKFGISFLDEATGSLRGVAFEGPGRGLVIGPRAHVTGAGGGS
jgi:hypothetical protein